MSGGSFNYLCFADASDIFAKSEDLRHMAEELEALGHQARKPAERTRALLAKREEVDAEIAALRGVWRAVEWWQSCDTSREDVFVAIGEYRAAEAAAKSRKDEPA